MSETQHSPTPYTVEVVGVSGDLYPGQRVVQDRLYISAGDFQIRICSMLRSFWPPHEKASEDDARLRATAAFMVRACNAHDDLLAACRSTLAAFSESAPGVDYYSGEATVLRAAIAKAER